MHATKALALALASSKMINVFLTLHLPNIDSLYLDSLLDFQLDSKLELYVDSFRSTFLCMYHLSIGGPFGMVFEHLCNSFGLKYLASGFIQLHHLCAHVAIVCILRFVLQIFEVNQLLALAKPWWHLFDCNGVGILLISEHGFMLTIS